MVDHSEKPLVCIKCGRWINSSDEDALFICKKCGYDNSPHREFYKQCYKVGEMLYKNHDARRDLKKIYTNQVRSSELWDVLAVVYSFLLGFTVNTSYDLTKNWIIRRKKLFQETYGKNIDLEGCVEIIQRFLEKNPDEIGEIQKAIQKMKRDSPEPE
uniref:Uncharacterized protein n=1 Tax=Candidatus Kentrum sp. DK TaxID=2126562 RepID=A0A450S3M0_9GAMM|nr:MAG: hypothetical protein BECKDK2373C_GA0170839_101447 [Candidatus Kentron sp. DK]